MEKQTPLPKATLIAATIISGLLWYFAIDLSGNYGFLLWIAPLPILWVSLQSTALTSVVCAFLAYLIGRMSWIPFLLVLMPLIPIIIITVLPPILFGMYILLNRWIVLKSQSALSVFAFPAIVSATEFLVFNNQIDGTAGGLAYTQSNYLAVIQVASLTGIWGIVFLVSMPSAAIVTAWYFRSNRRKQFIIAGATSVLLFATITFGLLRVNQSKAHTEVPIGITVVAEDLYSDTVNPELARNQILTRYLEQISSLANQGARYILFPEKIIQVSKNKKDSLLSVFQSKAVQINATIIGGLAIRKDSTRQNLVEFIPPVGAVQEYKKRFHVKVFEGDFEPGSNVGILHDIPFAGGMAICKDMDFPQWLREYRDMDLLFVPAWDFVQDGWLHSRMAILRGVENGYTIVRAGRQGRLTVSDYRGKVLNEVNAEKGGEASLVATAPLYHVDTLYSQWGDWFGWICLCSVVILVGQTSVISYLRKRRES